MGLTQNTIIIAWTWLFVATQLGKAQENPTIYITKPNSPQTLKGEKEKNKAYYFRLGQDDYGGP